MQIFLVYGFQSNDVDWCVLVVVGAQRTHTNSIQLSNLTQHIYVERAFFLRGNKNSHWLRSNDHKRNS